MSVHLVPDGLDGERVDVAASRMTGMSRSRAESLVEVLNRGEARKRGRNG